VVSAATEKVAHSTVALVTATILHHHAASSRVHGKGLSFSLLGCVLLPIMHFLHEGLCLLLVHKGQPGKTWWVLELERVKECAVLVVCESVVYFLIPYNASIGRGDINQLYPKGVSYQVVGQNRCTL
jgi:hypothetical protein